MRYRRVNVAGATYFFTVNLAERRTGLPPSSVREAAPRRGSAASGNAYWEHLIRGERDLARHVEYIHFNPVKHRFVIRAVEWPFSSIHRYVGLDL